MTRAVLTIVFVASLLAAWYVGQANGAESMLAWARSEHESALSEQEEALRQAQDDASQWRQRYAGLYAEYENAWLTIEAYQRELDQAKAERDRWRSLAGYRAGTAQ